MATGVLSVANADRLVAIEHHARVTNAMNDLMARASRNPATENIRRMRVSLSAVEGPRGHRRVEGTPGNESGAKERRRTGETIGAAAV
jgi:hypothetical protein